MTINSQAPAGPNTIAGAERPYTGLLLTENQLFQLFLTMDVVKSSNLHPEGEHYVPQDLVYDTPYGAGYEIGAPIIDHLSEEDEPGEELKIIVDDLQALYRGFKRLLEDFSQLKNSRSVMTKPEPNEDAPDAAWVEYGESLRYRMP